MINFFKIRNSATLMTWYSRLPNIINLFFIFPLVIKFFTIEQVALYFLFGSIIRLQEISDFGFSLNYSRFISYAYAGVENFTKDELDKNSSVKEINWNLINKVYSNMKITYLFLSIIFILTFGFFASYQVWPKIYSNNNLILLWCFLLLAVFIKIRFKYIENFIIGVNKVARLREITGNYNLIQNFIVFIALALTKNFNLLILINIFFLLFTTLRNFFLKKEITTDFNIIFHNIKFNKKINSQILPLSVKSGFGNVISLGLYNSVGFIFANTLSSNSLTILLLSNRFLDFIKDFSKAPFYSKIPYFATLYIKDKVKMLKEVKTSMIQAMFVYFVGVILVYIFSDNLLKIINPDFSGFSKLFWIFLCISFFIERYASMHIQLFNLSNNIKYHWINLVLFLIIVSSIYIFDITYLFTYPKSLLVGFLGFYLWISLYFSTLKYKLNILRTDFIFFLLINFLFFIIVICEIQ